MKKIMKKLLVYLSLIILLTSCDYEQTEKSIIIGDSIVYANEWEMDSYGVPGAQINYIIDNLPDLSQYEDVYILLGVNNLAVSNTPEYTKSEMDRLIALVGDKNIYVISILPLDNSLKIFPTNYLVEQTNLYYTEYPNFINAYAYLFYEKDILKADGIHLNEKGYSLLEPIIYDYVWE